MGSWFLFEIFLFLGLVSFCPALFGLKKFFFG